MSGETEEDISGWTTDTSREDLLARARTLGILLDERYATQVKALDAAFLAQQTVMRTAFEAADRAVGAALASSTKAVEVALAEVARTADMHAVAHTKDHLQHEEIHRLERIAIDKADESMNMRLLGMNEFRDQLRDQAATFVSRKEVESTLVASTAKADQAATTILARMDEDRSMVGKLSDDLIRIQTKAATQLTMTLIAIPVFSIIMNVVFYVFSKNPN